MSAMKIQFDANLDYQLEAVRSVTDLFRGQEISQTTFTVPAIADPSFYTLGGEQLGLHLGMEQNEYGIGNRLRLLDEDILKNLQEVQLRNGLPVSERLESMNFTVEMETGTGKTYVYLRTIFELNRQYGFTKFIIVVPSIAIKEGVRKSIEMSTDHFRALYDNVRFDAFVYDSQNLGQVRNFATSDYIQIMIINIDAFRRSFTDPEKEHKANIIHRHHDRMAGARPIEFIQATNPIVIIDEPQSVDTTAKSKEAIASLNPLFILRYSATHLERYHMVYRLDAVDAYERKLVKEIEVLGTEIHAGHNQGYIKLLSVDNRKSPITARIELDILQRGRVRRVTRTVRTGDDLYELSGNRDVYKGYIVEEIYCGEGNEYISFTSRPEIVRLGHAIGEIDDDSFKRHQIRRTIEEHLEKEMALRPRGIKVLSLFFIDRVANYRWYDEDGNPQKGKYALMFEEEYRKAIQNPRYRGLFKGADIDSLPHEVHNGYFAVDRRKDSTGNQMFKESRGDGTTQADESAYELIMRDKERLLSFDSKLKFIFSHSALREGWDNPNVFQICTLTETQSVMTKRQQIGRGLRIAVNQNGERVYGSDVNRLTIIANESYEDFARQLQKEIEEETGVRFGIIEPHHFANIVYTNEVGEVQPVGLEGSKKIWSYLREVGYIDSQDKVQDLLRIALQENKVQLPPEYEHVRGQIAQVLRRAAGKLNIRNAAERQRVKLNKAVYLSEDFKALWDRIKYRTTYRVHFDPEELIRKTAERIRRELVVSPTRFVDRKAVIDVTQGGVLARGVSERITVPDTESHPLPDIISYLQNETNLTRRTVAEILVRSRRLEDFKKNPQQFIEKVLEFIRLEMRDIMVKGIKYEKIGDDHFYAQELMEENELYGYLSKNMIESKKSVYEYVVYDSAVEESFARYFERNDHVKLYTKLPSWFKIDTPLGTYNPDWAVLVEKDGTERLYFVLETKAGLFSEALRPIETGKIACGRAHFEALGEDVGFEVVNNAQAFEERVLL